MIPYPHSQTQKPDQPSQPYSLSSELLRVTFVAPANAQPLMPQVGGNSSLSATLSHMQAARHVSKKPKQFTPLPRPARAKPLPELPYELVMDTMAASFNQENSATSSNAVHDMSLLISEIDGLIDESRKSPTGFCSPACIALKEYIAERTRKSRDVSENICKSGQHFEDYNDDYHQEIPLTRFPQSPANGFPPLLPISKRTHSYAWREKLGDSY
ncbi:hypothetical protein HDU82_008194 [Entophlyctis luteolus]|nr:hypothetical protein HDU82_008194 [Entophlyctis luteolus]